MRVNVRCSANGADMMERCEVWPRVRLLRVLGVGSLLGVLRVLGVLGMLRVVNVLPNERSGSAELPRSGPRGPFCF